MQPWQVMGSPPNTQLCCCKAKANTDSTETKGTELCSSKKSFYGVVKLEHTMAYMAYDFHVP